jgi:hypothetical protein
MIGDVNDYEELPLNPSESLDSDEVRNADGDEVVDPPERWIEATEHESLDERLADELPDVPPDDWVSSESHDSNEGGGLTLMSDDQLDRIDPSQHGRDAGQIDGTPEDGDSFYDVIE